MLRRLAAHGHLPDAGVQDAMAGRDLHQDGSTIGGQHGLQWQLLDIGVQVILMLPARRVEPLAEGETGLVFVNDIVGGAIPREFVPSIEKALRQSLLDGGPGGYPVLGLKVSLLDGAFHQKDSSGLAFELATLDPCEVPINFLDPRPGTPLGGSPLLSPREALQAIALFRLVLPSAWLRLAGGRELVLGERRLRVRDVVERVERELLR